MTLIEGDLDTILLRDEVGHLLLHVIAVLEYLRGALELRHTLEDIDTLHVRYKLTNLVGDLQNRELWWTSMTFIKTKYLKYKQNVIVKVKVMAKRCLK